MFPPTRTGVFFLGVPQGPAEGDTPLETPTDATIFMGIHSLSLDSTSEGPVQVIGCADQAEVGESLGEIAERFAG